MNHVSVIVVEKMKIIFPVMMLISMITNKDDNSLIDKTCKKTPNYQLCFSTLQSDPRSSKGADISVLGLVMVEAVRKKTVEIMESIKQLEISNPEWGAPLSECSMNYYAVVKADVPQAIDGLKKGVPKFAEMGMEDTAMEAEICEFAFKHNSPLTEMNTAIMELSAVAKSIIRMLL